MNKVSMFSDKVYIHHLAKLSNREFKLLNDIGIVNWYIKDRRRYDSKINSGRIKAVKETLIELDVLKKVGGRKVSYKVETRLGLLEIRIWMGKQCAYFNSRILGCYGDDELYIDDVKMLSVTEEVKLNKMLVDSGDAYFSDWGKYKDVRIYTILEALRDTKSIYWFKI